MQGDIGIWCKESGFSMRKELLPLPGMGNKALRIPYPPMIFPVEALQDASSQARRGVLPEERRTNIKTITPATIETTLAACAFVIP
jgi:hypothetical protein